MSKMLIRVDPLMFHKINCHLFLCVSERNFELPVCFKEGPALFCSFIIFPFVQIDFEK